MNHSSVGKRIMLPYMKTLQKKRIATLHSQWPGERADCHVTTLLAMTSRSLFRQW